MIAPWGRPPLDFTEIPPGDYIPFWYRSTDNGKTWKKTSRLKMNWTVGGYISDGEITLIRLRDERLMLTFHRSLPGFHGGGVPAAAYSSDEGEHWTEPQLLDDHERTCYLMNERTIQLRLGRILVPVATQAQNPAGGKYVEGGRCDALCYFSDNGGQSWRISTLTTLADQRGMAEPAVAELSDGRVMMLARTGSGSHHGSFSSDGGETWSRPFPTSLEAACSPLTFKRMPDDRLIVVFDFAKPLFEGAFFPRQPLAYSVSADNGKTWAEPTLIDTTEKRQLIYSAVTFLKNGILLVYSEHYDPGSGKFTSAQDRELSLLGGAKRCLIAYPD
jgi:Neuraminidase (sialidase)